MVNRIRSPYPKDGLLTTREFPIIPMEIPPPIYPDLLLLITPPDIFMDDDVPRNTPPPPASWSLS